MSPSTWKQRAQAPFGVGGWVEDRLVGVFGSLGFLGLWDFVDI